MSVETRQIDEIFYDIDGVTPLVGVPVRFQTDADTFSNDGVFVRHSLTAWTNAEGRLAEAADSETPGISLWCNSQGFVPTRYVCYLPSRGVKSFTLEPGAATTLHELFALFTDVTVPYAAVVKDYIDSEIAAAITAS